MRGRTTCKNIEDAAQQSLKETDRAGQCRAEHDSPIKTRHD